MSGNIYAAPMVDLKEEPLDSSQSTFYVVSEMKFLVLFVVTFGMYSFYWFYKNWQLYRESSGESLWPIPRAIFAIFFVHSLFRHVAEKIAQRGIDFEWNCESQASLVVVLLIVRNIVDRLVQKSIGSPYTDILLILLLLPLAFALLRSQAAINVASEDPKGQSNRSLSFANYVWIVIGIIFWILVLVGMFAS